MSRIGNQPISIPKGVTVSLSKDNIIEVKGPKGALSQQVSSLLEVLIADEQVILKRKSEQKQDKSMHGLCRSLVNNMVIGVTEGYKRGLELIGIGYKAIAKGNLLELHIGKSHVTYVLLPAEVSLEVKTERGKNPTICLESIDKQLVGQVAAKIRSLRKPEPYKGKGIRYVGEEVMRKPGKAAGK